MSSNAPKLTLDTVEPSNCATEDVEQPTESVGDSDAESNTTIQATDLASESTGPVEGSATETPNRQQWNIDGVIYGALMVGIAVISGVLGAAMFDRFKSEPPPPQIMVVDMAALLQPISNDPTLNAYEKRQITEDIGETLRIAIAQHAENGSIVLDASAVLNAPEQNYVQP